MMRIYWSEEAYFIGMPHIKEWLLRSIEVRVNINYLFTAFDEMPASDVYRRKLNLSSMIKSSIDK